jgi:bacterioferritin (cytochrome b1)
MSVIANTKAAKELEQLETEINTEAFEAFFHIGQKLLRIKTERLYESAGFKSWSQYCASGRIEYQKSQADRYIRASELRPKLGYSGTHSLGVKEMLELCKCETDNDAKRVAKKAIAQAEKTGERVTARLIAEIRDGVEETGVAAKKLDKQLEAASLDTHLTNLANQLVDWRKSLEGVDFDQRDGVQPRIMARAIRELEALTTFLKG